VTFRSDQLRAIYREAIEQRFTSGFHGSQHVFVECPQPECEHREILTTTGRAYEHELKKKICRLRKHGFVWKGRGGQHV
jgi:hypothetical protein